MAQVALDMTTRRAHPLDVVEQVVAANGWTFERPGDDEVAAEVSADGGVYRLWFSWVPERETLHLSCGFEVKLAQARSQGLFELLARINERLWMGHFDLWSEQGLVTFRHSLPLCGGPGVLPEQVTELVEVALAECERFLPAFQYVIWGGASPGEAVEIAALDTVGEA